MGKIGQKILNATKTALEREDRRGNNPHDPRKDPNYKRWVDKADEDDVVGRLTKPKSAEFHNDGLEDFFASDVFKQYDGKGKSKAFEAKLHVVRNGVSRSKTAAVTTIADIRDVGTIQRLPGVVPLGVAENRLGSLMPQYEATGSAVAYLREVGFVNSAAGRPENIDPASTTASTRSTIDIDKKQANVETVDHYIDFPQELLEDQPALIQFLRDRMGDGLEDNKDAMILSGAGPGSNEFLGFYADTDVPAYAWSSGSVGDNMADAVLMAMVLIHLAKEQSDATVLSIADYAAIVKMKDTAGNYLIPQAHNQGTMLNLWGKPCLQSVAASAGTGLTGAFRRKAAIWTRAKRRYRMTDAHLGRFLDGILTLLVECREALTIFRPEAFREITFDNAPS